MHTMADSSGLAGNQAPVYCGNTGVRDVDGQKGFLGYCRAAAWAGGRWIG